LLDQISAAQARLESGQTTRVGDKGAGRAVAMVSVAARPMAVVSSSPPMARTFRHVLALADLAPILETAKREKALAIALATTSQDAMRAQILGVSLAVAEGEGIYVPVGHRYLGAPAQIAWADL